MTITKPVVQRIVLLSILVIVAWSGVDTAPSVLTEGDWSNTGNTAGVPLPGHDENAGLRNTTLQMKLPSFTTRKKKTEEEGPVSISLSEHPSSGLLRGDFYYGKHGNKVGLIIDTKSSNVLVLDESFQVEDDTQFYRSESKSKKKSKKKEYYVEYSDKSGYWGTQEYAQMQVMNPATSSWVVLKKSKFVLTLASRMNDAAASIRGDGYAGVMGLNGLAKDTNGGTNFAQKLMEKKMLNTPPSFSLFVASKERHTSSYGGKLFFGGVDKTYLAPRESMVYFPIPDMSRDEEANAAAAPCWAIVLKKMMIGATVVLENVVAEFDSALSGGVSDLSSGYLARHYIDIATKESEKQIGTPFYEYITGGVKVDCSKVEAHAPAIRFVADDVNGNSHEFAIKPEELFPSMLEPDQNGMCTTRFFTPEYTTRVDGDDGEDKKIGDYWKADKPKRVRLGLEFMQYFYTEYRMPQRKGIVRRILGKKKKGTAERSAAVGIGRAKRATLKAIEEESWTYRAMVAQASSRRGMAAKKKNRKNNRVKPDQSSPEED